MRIFIYKLFVSIVLTLLASSLLLLDVTAQEKNFRQSGWRYGANLGVQYNAASLGWQFLYEGIPSFQSPVDEIVYVDGTGIGAYGGLFGSYLSPHWWGVEMRMSYDQRDALVIDETKTPNSSFETNVNYLTFEPLFRLDQPLIPGLNFYAGPIIAFNMNASFHYKLDKDQTQRDGSWDIINFNNLTYGGQVGMGYDIKISDFSENSSMYITPFIDASFIVDQKHGRLVETQNSTTDVWSTTSYRFGIKLSFEERDPIKKDELTEYTPAKTKVTTTEIKKVDIIMPDDNEISTKNIQGYFPIHNFVFFEKGNQEIPFRYTLLSKEKATNFKESDLEDFVKGDLTVKETNVDQLMVSYYNILNIYGDRMRKNPRENVILRASDPESIDAAISANRIKTYLVDIFGISPDRISIEVEPPSIPSGSIYTEEVSKNLIADENRRVKFVFSNPEMTKPLKYTIRDESSIDNDLVFNIGKNVNYKSWDVTITGEGKTMYFGPYKGKSSRINPSELMKFLENGKYNAKVSIIDKNGVTTEENYAFRLNKTRELKNASRYLMIFDYNDDNAVKSYETKIVKEIAPGMVTGNRVIVHGHTDNIGTEEGNDLLSQKRANEVKEIIEKELNKTNKKVKLNAIGRGQDLTQFSFNNRYPEGRMYNRNVFVEVIQ